MTPFRTVLIGFGKMAAGYSLDPRQTAWYNYCTHAQALRDHPLFDWQAVIDCSDEALAGAKQQWGVAQAVRHADELISPEDIEVAVIATPPDARRGLIRNLPGLRAVVIEKPLGNNLEEAESLLRECRERNVLVGVNLPRRYDLDMRDLAAGRRCPAGNPMAVFGTYGNGLRNNGTHLVDTVRMLFGEVARTGIPPGAKTFVEGSILGDINVPFTLTMASGLAVMVQPLCFRNYREVSLDIWGEVGRLQLVHESLTELVSLCEDNRQLSCTYEIAHDRQAIRTTSIGDALYRVYDNVAAAIKGREALLCPGDEALKTMRVIETVYRQANEVVGS